METLKIPTEDSGVQHVVIEELQLLDESNEPIGKYALLSSKRLGRNEVLFSIVDTTNAFDRSSEQKIMGSIIVELKEVPFEGFEQFCSAEVYHLVFEGEEFRNKLYEAVKDYAVKNGAMILWAWAAGEEAKEEYEELGFVLSSEKNNHKKPHEIDLYMKLVS